MGIRVERDSQRVIISIHCVVEPGQYWDNDYYDGDDELDDEEVASVVTGDHILDTLSQVTIFWIRCHRLGSN